MSLQITASRSRIAMALFAATITMLLALGLSVGQAQAISLDKLTLDNATGTCKVTTSLGQNWGSDQTTDTFTLFSKNYSFNTTPKKVKSSNKSVVAIADYDGGYIDLTFKKAGTANVTYTWKGKAHKVKFIVYKYTNPVATFNVGSKKFASKLKKSAIAYYDPFLGGKVQVKAKKGWTLKKLQTIGDSQKTIKNGAKIKKGKVSLIVATLQNKKTKVMQTVTVNVGAAYGG